jgi:hypothetical protein
MLGAHDRKNSSFWQVTINGLGCNTQIKEA